LREQVPGTFGDDIEMNLNDEEMDADHMDRLTECVLKRVKVKLSLCIDN
jgi:hypothetical protein